jgi:hypothetical protein
LFPLWWVSSEANALEVASAVLHFLAHPDEVSDKSFALDVSKVDGSMTERIWIRPERDVAICTLVTGHEIVKCMSTSGEVVDLLLPPPDDRALCPVVIVRREA